MFVLHLNDMRSSNIENTTPVARAETKEELKRFMDQEVVEPYNDGSWGKVFRKGGPLEWYNGNAAYNIEQSIADAGTEEQWMENARQNYQDQVMSLPDVESFVPSQVEGVMASAG